MTKAPLFFKLAPMKPSPIFQHGFRAMLPVTFAVVPFGIVVGTVCAEAGLDFFKTMSMNIILYAGASQLAATELMSKQASSFVVIATGLMINLRFLLYSAALAPVVQKSGFWVKFASAFTLTDQGYTIMSANQSRYKTTSELLQFHFGTTVCMFLCWHLSVGSGFIFGNFAPASWSLDYAIPLSFVSLVIPTLMTKKHLAVAVFSSVVSILLYSVPYKLGLIITALLAIALGAFISRKRNTA